MSKTKTVFAGDPSEDRARDGRQRRCSNSRDKARSIPTTSSSSAMTLRKGGPILLQSLEVLGRRFKSLPVGIVSRCTATVRHTKELGELTAGIIEYADASGLKR